MQIRKTYMEVNPELLYAEIRDFALKQDIDLDESSLETYTQPDQSADFVSRGKLTFKCRTGGKTCLQAHIVGTPRAETKLMMDVDEDLFSRDKLSALQGDIDFIFGSYELKE